MKLLFNGKDISVRLLPTSGRVRILVEDLESSRGSLERWKATFAMAKNGDESTLKNLFALGDSNELAEAQIKALQPIITSLRNGDISVTDAAKMQAVEFGYADIIEYFKKIIDRSKLNDDQIALIDSEPHDDFWLDQDIVKIESEVNSFRGLFGFR